MAFALGKRYHVIYADCPWKYRDKKKNGRGNHGAENKYLCMKDEALLSLPIHKLAEDNAVLFLWVTAPLLFSDKKSSQSVVGRLIESWGFKFKTVAFTWIKTYADGRPWFGVGSYTKSNAELCLMATRGEDIVDEDGVEYCLLATRGKVGRLVKDSNGQRIITNPEVKLSVASNMVSQVVHAERTEHSQKPDVFRRRIQELFDPVSRLEIFARRRPELEADEAEGSWDFTGLEYDSLSIEDVLAAY